jgi:hypothetical protein
VIADKETVILSLMASKGWLRDFATAYVEDMIANHQRPAREPVLSAQRQKFSFDRYSTHTK